MAQSPDIGQFSDGGIYDFFISDQFLIKENSHNSRTSDDIEMKSRPVTKLDKRNKTTSKIFDDDAMSRNALHFEQFGSWIPEAEFSKVIFS